MNKYLKQVSLALAAGLLLAACGGKGSNGTTPEPTRPPTPVTPNNGGGTTGGGSSTGGTTTPTNTKGNASAASDFDSSDNTPRIELNLAADQNTFTLMGLYGGEVTVTGATSSVVDASGNVTEWKYSASSPVAQTFTAAKAGDKIVIKGNNLESIAITAGNFEAIYLDKAPSTFKGFYFFEEGNAGTISLSKLSLGSISTLENLYLGTNPLHSRTGPDITGVLDLSKLNSLKGLGLHRFNANDRKITKFPSNLSVLRDLELSETVGEGMPEFTTANYPALVNFIFRGADLKAFSAIDFSNHTALKVFTARRGHMPGNINLSNNAVLSNVSFTEIMLYGTTKVIDVRNTPKLTDTSNIRVDSSVVTVKK